MNEIQVLIVGAGPTGLVLALWLARLGVAFRIIDRAPGPGTSSRALGVQARTLEYYHQLGIAERVVARGLPFTAANFWARGRHAGRAAFGEMGRGISPYPFMLVFPQDEHEALLEAELAALGVTVQRNTELVHFEHDADGGRAKLRGPEGDQIVTAQYLAGCDGARSRVRELTGVGFAGGTYSHRFYVADAVAHGPVVNGELHVAVDADDFLAAFPMAGGSRVRLIGTVREPDPDAPSPTWDDVGKQVLQRLGVTVDRVNWFSTYHVHHRVAGAFRKDRAFLLGDAAHIHSPVGGQGMNTGIADAVNLSWKLAAVLQGRAAPALLDSYEPERIAFARRLVATTDRAFTAVTDPGRAAAFVRTQVMPRVFGLLTRFAAVRRFLMFRTVSQTALEYRASPISEGEAGSVHGGDRLPWVAGADGTDNFAALCSLNWQMHVYGEASPAIVAASTAKGIPLLSFDWSKGAERSGLARDAAYLVRPDGYVGWAGTDAAALGRYLEQLAIRPLDARQVSKG